MARGDEVKRRKKKVRTFRIDRLPAVKGQDPDLRSTKWEEVRACKSREDAEFIVSLLKPADSGKHHFAVIEIIETGGRQLV